jgi:hypothetical protein
MRDKDDIIGFLIPTSGPGCFTHLLYSCFEGLAQFLIAWRASHSISSTTVSTVQHPLEVLVVEDLTEWQRQT